MDLPVPLGVVISWPAEWLIASTEFILFHEVNTESGGEVGPGL
jgi:hypothetical protein